MHMLVALGVLCLALTDTGVVNAQPMFGSGSKRSPFSVFGRHPRGSSELVEQGMRTIMSPTSNPQSDNVVIGHLKNAKFRHLLPILRPYYRATWLKYANKGTTKKYVEWAANNDKVKWYRVADMDSEVLRQLNPLGQLIREGREELALAVFERLCQFKKADVALTKDQADLIVCGDGMCAYDLLEAVTLDEARQEHIALMVYRMVASVAVLTENNDALTRLFNAIGGFYGMSGLGGNQKSPDFVRAVDKWDKSDEFDFSKSSLAVPIFQATLFWAQVGAPNYEGWRNAMRRYSGTIRACAALLHMSKGAQRLGRNYISGFTEDTAFQCAESFGLPPTYNLEEPSQLEDLVRLQYGVKDYQLAQEKASDTGRNDQ
ncbi:hypothetical protein H4R34_000550 [Dimargaris verticillata]|uniref:Uncharacterized protein n=1 Tax=Dimargaris verticillata TaxID=2761393 RepID=A0A9W8BBL6_9FUNG|nr:hypothetical protein H4R34_000550 [Dimargaris verticillata]